MWAQGWVAWKSADQAAEFAPLFAQTPPPMPQPSQPSALDEKIKAYMLGEWAAQTGVAGAPDASQTVSVRHSADGSFTGYIVQSSMGQQATSPVQGRWSVASINDTKFTLTMTPQGSAGSSAVELIVDQNTQRDENDGTISRA